MRKEDRFSIGEAARICGVTAKQIRNWESKNYIPSPHRIICGDRSYRQYVELDLKLIRRIGSYLEEGFNLPTAARKAAVEISNGKGD